MSVRIQPSERDPHRVNITTNTEKFEGVRVYGKKQGKIAEFMGLATELRGEDNKVYYVNIRSIGRVSYEKSSPSGKTAGKVIRSAKQFQGIKIVDDIKSAEDRDEYIFNNFATKIKGNEAIKKDIENIVSELLFDESNLTAVYDKLKAKVKESYPSEYVINAKFASDNYTDFGKLKLIKGISSHVSPDLYKPIEESSIPLSRKERKKAELFKEGLFAVVKDPVERYFRILDLSTGINDKWVKKWEFSKIIADLKWNKSNIDEVCTKLNDEMLVPANTDAQGQGPDTASHDAIKDYLNLCSPAEKLQFIELFRQLSLPAKE